MSLTQVGRDLIGNGSVRVTDVEALVSGRHVLRRATFDCRHANGNWSREQRETYDRGNGATILLHHVDRGTVLLSKQFRYPVYVNANGECGEIADAKTIMLLQWVARTGSFSTTPRL